MDFVFKISLRIEFPFHFVPFNLPHFHSKIDKQNLFDHFRILIIQFDEEIIIIIIEICLTFFLSPIVLKKLTWKLHLFWKQSYVSTIYIKLNKHLWFSIFCKVSRLSVSIEVINSSSNWIINNNRKFSNKFFICRLRSRINEMKSIQFWVKFQAEFIFGRHFYEFINPR